MDVGFVRDHLNQDPTVSAEGLWLGAGGVGRVWWCGRDGVFGGVVVVVETVMFWLMVSRLW